MTDTNALNSPCHVPVPDGVSECGLSELPSSIHSDDETQHDAFFVQTCVEEVENAEYVPPLKPLLSMRVEDAVDEELDPRSRLREYVDSKRKLVVKKLCYAKPTRSSWPLKQGRMVMKVPTRTGPCCTPSTRHSHGPAPHQALHHKQMVKIAPSHRSPAAPSTIQIQIHTAGFRSTHRLSHGGGRVQELHQRGSPEIGI